MATKKERTDKQTNREGNAEEVHADEADTQGPGRWRTRRVYIYIYRESINGEGRWRRVVFRGPAALETG